MNVSGFLLFSMSLRQSISRKIADSRRRHNPIIRLITLGSLIFFGNMAFGGIATIVESDPLYPSPGRLWQTLPLNDGSNWLGYYDGTGQLRITDPGGKHRLIAPTFEKSTQSALKLVSSPGGPIILWREKIPGKRLYVKLLGQESANAIEIADDTEPLTRLDAVVDKDNILHILWYGEKNLNQGEHAYHIYYRNLDLNTNALSPVEQVLGGHFPMLCSDPVGNILVMSWENSDQPYRMLSRLRDKTTGVFGPPGNVADIPNMAALYKLIHLNGRFMAFWLAMRDTPEVFQLEGAFSDDRGKTWEPMKMPGLEGLDLISLDIDSQGESTLMMAISGRYRKDVSSNKDKFQIRLVKSEDKGATWSDPISPRTPSVDGKFNALFPKLVFGPGTGELLLVWQDWRDIRSRLYFSYSTTGGKDWQISNLSFPANHKNAGLWDSDLDLWLDANQRFNLVSTLAKDDNLNSYDIVKQEFTREDLFALAGLTATPHESTEQNRSRPTTAGIGNEANLQHSKSPEGLRERVEAFWQTMRNEDYSASYAFYDPFYRAQHNTLQYFQNLGNIKYNAVDIGDIKVDGNIASVEVKVKAAVPKMKIKTTGEEVEKPEKNIGFVDTWLWVDDGWYREYYLQGKEIKWTRY